MYDYTRSYIWLTELMPKGISKATQLKFIMSEARKTNPNAEKTRSKNAKPKPKTKTTNLAAQHSDATPTAATNTTTTATASAEAWAALHKNALYATLIVVVCFFVINF